MLSGPASFSHSGFQIYSVCSISQKRLFPSSVTEFKRLKSTFAERYAYWLLTPDPFGAGIGG